MTWTKASGNWPAPPEYSYLLAFSPQNLKFDGHFHNLKVTVKGPQKLNIQSRKGYYAPKQAADAAATSQAANPGRGFFPGRGA